MVRGAVAVCAAVAGAKALPVDGADLAVVAVVVAATLVGADALIADALLTGATIGVVTAVDDVAVTGAGPVVAELADATVGVVAAFVVADTGIVVTALVVAAVGVVAALDGIFVALAVTVVAVVAVATVVVVAALVVTHTTAVLAVFVADALVVAFAAVVVVGLEIEARALAGGQILGTLVGAASVGTDLGAITGLVALAAVVGIGLEINAGLVAQGVIAVADAFATVTDLVLVTGVAALAAVVVVGRRFDTGVDVVAVRLEMVEAFDDTGSVATVGFCAGGLGGAFVVAVAAVTGIGIESDTGAVAGGGFTETLVSAGPVVTDFVGRTGLVAFAAVVRIDGRVDTFVVAVDSVGTTAGFGIGVGAGVPGTGVDVLLTTGVELVGDVVDADTVAYEDTTAVETALVCGAIIVGVAFVFTRYRASRQAECNEEQGDGNRHIDGGSDHVGRPGGSLRITTRIQQ